MNRKTAAIAAVVVLACFSCAHLGKKPAVMHPGVTIEPVDKEGILRLIPDEEKNGGPAFVNLPNPFSHKQLYFFHLPATARTRIELCDDDGKVVSTLIDEHMQKGVYQLSIIPAVFLLENGKYTLKLNVAKKLVGTKEFTVSRPGRFGKNPVEILPGITVVSLNDADVRPYPGEENTGGPAFVMINKFSSPFSDIICYCFHLPAAARTRIEIYNDESKVVSTLIDEYIQKGAYKLTFGRPFPPETGKYTLKLNVDKKLVGTRNFTIIK